jgi:PAS domain S-box-containing protein
VTSDATDICGVRHPAELLRTLYEHSTEGVLVTSPEGDVFHANPAACHLLGRSEAEIRLAGRAGLVVPGPALDAFLEERQRTGIARGELKCLKADGRAFPVDATGVMVPNLSGGPLAYVIFRDVSASLEAEELSREARLHAAETEAVFAALSDGVLVYDTARTVRRANPAFQATYGFDPVGLHVGEVIARVKARSPDGQPIALEDHSAPRARRGERVVGTRFLIDPPGRDPMVVEGSSGPLHVGGEVVGSVTVWRDVTERTHVEEALRLADHRKDEFLGMLSHELRNPLAAIQSAVYILDHVEGSSPPAGRARSVIRRQVEHLTRLVEDLLDITRIARGKIELRRERLELLASVRLAVEDQRTQLDRYQLALRLHLPDEPLWVEGDATRLNQVVGNLLQNAVKFTPQGGQIELEVERVGQAVELRVRDNGAGIAPEMLDRVFDQFVQGDQTLDRASGGLGLGLAIVRALVELHGGTVRASSEGLGHGSEFAVRLPLAAPPTVIPGGRAEVRPTGPARSVLVVDDNVDAAQTLAELLGLLGHRVRVVYDGPSALALARAEPPDFVLCDLGLPGMTGLDVARALRADPGLARTRLVAVSGYAHLEDRLAASEAGFDQHLAKPPALVELQRIFA